MISIKPVTDYGQIKAGDTLVLENSKGIKFVATARAIIRAGTPQEEILLSKRSNDYFIMEMFLDGKSWVKNASILIDVKLTTLVNNFTKLKNLKVKS